MTKDNNEYYFGDFFLRHNEILFKNMSIVHIPPKELHLLSILIEHYGHVVKKEDLITQIWKGGIVSDASLTRCIYMIRKILNESKPEEYIKTVYGKGYVFSYPLK